MRAICYPQYVDNPMPKVIPNNGNGGFLLNVDYAAMTIKWNETLTYDKKLLNKYWNL